MADPTNNNISNKSKRTEYLSVTQLMILQFKKHRLANYALVGLVIMYSMAIISEFIAPYNSITLLSGYTNVPPSTVHWFDENGNWFGPYVYALDKEIDKVTYQTTLVEITAVKHPIKFFLRSWEYKILGVIKTDIHLFGLETQNKDGGDEPEAVIVLFGTDNAGRDIFSRTIIGSRVSLFIGLTGVFISFILGSFMGGISGYFGGTVDNIIQRVIEILMSIPTIPLWIVLSAAIPRYWSVTATYFAITVVLAVVGWTGLARVVRGKLLSLREIDFVLAAKACGSSDIHAIVTHLLPNFLSYLIVSITIAIPGMILAETALSFIGLGMQDPAVSWGVLLQDTMNFTALVQYPWKMIPAIFVVLVVMMYNSVGDGLRDAADPYSL